MSSAWTKDDGSPGATRSPGRSLHEPVEPPGEVVGRKGVPDADDRQRHPRVGVQGRLGLALALPVALVGKRQRAVESAPSWYESSTWSLMRQR